MVHIIYDDIYCKTTVYVFGEKYLSFKKLRPKLHDKFTDDEIRHFIEQEKNLGGIALARTHFGLHVTWVYIKEWKDEPAYYALLSHEIFHVADLTLREKGFVLSDDSQEAWAYLIQFHSREIFSKIMT